MTDLPVKRASVLRADTTAILVVDVQERLLGAMPEAVLPALEKNLRTLAVLARELELPVVVSEQYPKGLGPTWPPLLEALEGHESLEVYEKLSFSVVGNGSIREALERLAPRTTLLVVGLEAHICVLQSCLDLIERGFRVHLAVDATASRRKLHWAQACRTLEKAGVTITNVETFAFRLLSGADAPAFKAISRAIR